jgi:transposase
MAKANTALMMSKPTDLASEFPATNFLAESVSKEIATLLQKSESKLRSASIQKAELMREYERIQARINNMTELQKLLAQQRELKTKIKQMSALIDSLGFSMNETLTQALEHVEGKTLTEKAKTLRGER